MDEEESILELQESGFVNESKNKKPWENYGSHQGKKKKNPELKNQRVKKYVQPKNAVMCLNEVKSGLQFVTEKENMTEPYFVMSVEVDGKKYCGSGKTKQLAKQVAAEAALASLVKPTSFLDSYSTHGIPWASIASFALYKLLKEWDEKRLGSVTNSTIKTIPDLIGCPNTSVSLPKGENMPLYMTPKPIQIEVKPSHVEALNAHLSHHHEVSKLLPAKQLPDNADSLHPVVVLHQMKPNITYNKIAIPDPKTVDQRNYVISTTIDDREFKGEGSTIRKAKLNLAKEAMKVLFDIESKYENESGKLITEMEKLNVE